MKQRKKRTFLHVVLKRTGFHLYNGDKAFNCY